MTDFHGLTTSKITYRFYQFVITRYTTYIFVVPKKILGTLSTDNEMHDDDVRNPRRIGSRVSFLVGERKVRQCVVLRRRRLLVLRLVALAMAFKNVRNLLLINRNDGFIDDDEFVLLYDLFVSKDLDFP